MVIIFRYNIVFYHIVQNIIHLDVEVHKLYLYITRHEQQKKIKKCKTNFCFTFVKIFPRLGMRIYYIRI